MTKPFAPSHARPSGPAVWLSSLALLLASQACYHATGIQRSTPVAEEIPSSSGDRVPGLKSAAGPGDFFIGNDAVSLAVDGLPYGGGGVPIAGAVSGGSIVDVGHVQLDNSYKRTFMPADMVERLTAVVNQNPRLQVVIDSYSVSGAENPASLVMRGGIYDLDAGERMPGIAVTQKITLAETDKFFLLETTVTNRSGAAAAIRSIGDYFIQKGGGYRLDIPAFADNNGNPLDTWGVQIPGTAGFDTASSVRSTMVGLMGVEPAAPTYDAHTSLGILPVDEDYVLVACDAQDSFNETRPVFPANLVVGKPEASTDLADGASLTYRRRLYAEGGNTLQGSSGTKTYAYTYPNQATGVFNRMTRDRQTLRPSTSAGCGWASFMTSGSAARYGGAPTEIRIEKSPEGTLVRTEWLEPQEIQTATASMNPRIWLYLPVDNYQIRLQNWQPQQWSDPATYIRTRFLSDPFTDFIDANDDDHPSTKVPLLVVKDPYEGDRTKSSDSDFVITGSTLCPEYGQVVSEAGTVFDNAFYPVSLYAIERNAPTGHLQPLRWTIRGNSVPDPQMRRTRSLGGTWDPAAKGKGIAGLNYGCYAFGEGNQVFGTGFKSTAPFLASIIKGDYTLFGTRGPLSLLQTRDFTVSTSSTNAYTFIIFPAGQPSGWTTLDLPGPSLASSGGLLPVEKLAGALAEGIQVVAHTEEDLLTPSTALRDEFRKEFTLEAVTDAMRTAVGTDPYVVPARSSDLRSTHFGQVTALFTPDPTSGRNRGARLPDQWTLSDFIKQAEGQYQVLLRPRGPEGVFTAQHPSGAISINDSWLAGTGSHSYGTLNGAFDAIELLSAQALIDLGDPGAWFAEFKTLRADWFSLLNGQTPTAFTKALGCSSSRYTKDTPVGLARTYLKTVPYSTTNPTGFKQDDLSPLLVALRSGAAVASTGPFLDVQIAGSGPGSLVTSASGSVELTVSVMIGDWLAMDEVRVIVNGEQVLLRAFGTDPAAQGWTQDASDSRKWTQSFTLNLTQDAWVVVEGGVPLSTTGEYGVGTAWHKVMKGIYPVAVANPIFVDFGADGYQPPVS